MEEKEKNTSEPANIKAEEKENLTKTQVINLEKIKSPDIEIGKEDKDVDFGELIEEKRKNLFGKYKKSRKINNIIMVGVVALVVMGFIFVAQQIKGLQIAGIVVMVATLFGLITYYIATKNKFPNETKKYIQEISIDMDKHVFKDDRFKDMVTNANTKIEITEVTSDRVYLTPSDIGSRNVCEGHFANARFKVSELALYQQVDRKKRETLFVGKYISMDNSLKMDGRLIINIKGPKNLDLPTDIEDLVTIKEEGNMTCYAPEGFNLNSVLSSKDLSAIKKIDVKDNLLNINICLWGGHTAIYLSYDDPVVTLPFDKEFVPSAIDQYRDNLLDILKIFSEK